MAFLKRGMDKQKAAGYNTPYKPTFYSHLVPDDMNSYAGSGRVFHNVKNEKRERARLIEQQEFCDL